MSDAHNLPAGVTEEPWFIHDFSDPQIGGRPYSITVSCSHPDTLPIFDMNAGLTATYEEAMANAKFLTAAPKMYRTLRKALQFIHDEYRDNRYEDEGEWLAPEAREIYSDIVDALVQAET